MIQRKVFVVDDEPDILDGISYMLEEEGYDVITDRGEQVYEKAKKNKPDIILLDILLSGKRGDDVAKYLKSKKDTKHIPIILISAHPDVKYALRASGANNFLAKPFAVEALLTMIKQYVD